MTTRIHSLTAGIAQVYLVETGDGLVIVDAGWRGLAGLIMRRVERLGYRPQDVRLIFLTHAHLDHAGNAAELRRRTGAPIALHRGDAEYARAGKHLIPTGRGWAGATSKWLLDHSRHEFGFEPFEPDVWLDEGQSPGDFGISGRVLHTPGHTQGSVTLALDDGTFLVGDALINMFRVGYPMYWEQPEIARLSGQRICGLAPRIIYSGHGRPFFGSDLAKYLERYTAKKERTN